MWCLEREKRGRKGGREGDWEGGREGGRKREEIGWKKKEEGSGEKGTTSDVTKIMLGEEHIPTRM